MLILLRYLSGYQIDKVYVSSGIVPQNVKLVTDTFGGKYASDHFAVYATGRIEL